MACSHVDVTNPVGSSSSEQKSHADTSRLALERSYCWNRQDEMALSLEGPAVPGTCGRVKTAVSPSLGRNPARHCRPMMLTITMSPVTAFVALPAIAALRVAGCGPSTPATCRQAPRRHGPLHRWRTPTELSVRGRAKLIDPASNMRSGGGRGLVFRGRRRRRPIRAVHPGRAHRRANPGRAVAALHALGGRPGSRAIGGCRPSSVRDGNRHLLSLGEHEV